MGRSKRLTENTVAQGLEPPAIPARFIGTELVGDHTTRPATLLVKKAFQQSLGAFGVAAKLDDFVENITILIDGPPEVASLTVDRYDDFVQVLGVESTGLFRFKRRA